jgi:hypothetical protein
MSIIATSALNLATTSWVFVACDETDEMRLCRRGIEDFLVGAAQLHGVKPSARVHESVAGVPLYHAPPRLRGRMYAASKKCWFFFDA